MPRWTNHPRSRYPEQGTRRADVGRVSLRRSRAPRGVDEQRRDEPISDGRGALSSLRADGEGVDVTDAVLLITACIAPIAPFLYALVWGRW
jgi:hypothetical protein